MPRILLVADDPSEQERLEPVLRQLGALDACSGPEAGLSALARGPVDVVVADLAGEGAASQNLVARLRRERPGADLVGIASGPERAALLRAGAAACLPRPADLEELRLVMERVLAGRRLLAEAVRLRDELATREACRALVPCLEPGEVYAVTLDLLLRTLSRWRGLALFRRLPFSGSDGAVFRGFSELEASRLRQLLAQDKPLDLEAPPRPAAIVRSGPLHEALVEAGIVAGPVLALPLQGQDGEAGLVFVMEDDRAFEGTEIERARAIATEADLALANAERYVRAKERAFIDDCTEVYNARYLIESLDREIRRAERYGSPLSVLFIDLDRFKLVNDHHGHLVGSQALRQLSQVILQCVRQVDTLARYGGDEFTVVLVDTDFEIAQRVAERIRRTVEETLFDAGRGHALRLTCSVGVATYPLHGTAREQLLDVADKAMYRAKSNGRNRVCTADDLLDA